MTPFLLAALALQPVADAPPPAAPCPLPLAAPAPFANWTRPLSLAAAQGADLRRAPRLAVGRAATVTLAPVGRVRFMAVPAKLGPPTSYGGVLVLEVARPGAYRVALGTPGWIDLVAAGHALPSVAHTHGPACSGISKLVDFQLARGSYLVQISAAPASVATVEVAPAP